MRVILSHHSVFREYVRV